VLGLARSAASPSEARPVLAEICLAYSDLTRDHLFVPRDGGRPAGRPTRQVARDAAALLVATSSPDASRLEARQHLVGLITSNAAPVNDSGSIDPAALHEAVTACRTAARIAACRDEKDLRAWAFYVLCRLYRRAADSGLAWETALAAREAALQALSEATGDWAPASAAGLPAWLEPAETYRRVLAVLSVKVSGRVAAVTGRYNPWAEMVQEAGSLAEPLRHTRRRLYAQAILGAVSLARVRGDRNTFARVEAKLSGDLAVVTDAEEFDALRRALDSARVGNAEALKDWERCLELNNERLGYLCQRVGERAAEAGGTVPSGAREVLIWLQARGDRAWRTSIGNSALSKALALYRLGVTATDAARYDEACELLDLAFDAYHDYGSDGFVGIKLTRARLMHSAPGGPAQPLAATIAQLVDVSRRSQQAATRRNAIVDAVRLCEPGDREVLERIDEMLADDQGVYVYHLRAARVLWLRKKALSAGDDGTWRAVEREALDAAAGLEPDGKLIDPGLAVDCWSAAEEAARHLPGRPRPERLLRLLSAVRCLAIQLLSLTSSRERAEFGVRHRGLLVATVDLASELGDAAATEFVMEAVRRDRAGLLLAELARHPRVSESVRVTAERVLAANSAIPREPAGGDPGDQVRAWAVSVAADIDDQRQAAAAAAAAVIGPLATLADVSTLSTISSTAILKASAPRGRPAAVLQLLASGTGFLQGARRALYWVLTWTHGGDLVQQACGRAALPTRPEALTAESLTFWSDIYKLARLLLPAPLREFLAGCGRSNPAVLTVIPTGVLAVPFDCLPVDERLGLQVVDCASVVVTGSMAVTAALGRLADSPAEAEWLAVFDTDALAHTQGELTAMQRHHYPVIQIRTAGQLAELLGAGHTPGAVLAMGVHGSNDAGTGWGQAKKLPDGTILRAVDILQWRTPRLCVLASCHSTLTAQAGIELAGFPMAMLLRGARTVIGSVHELYDDSTGEIMQAYWKLIGNGSAPVDALREAKLSWLDADPARRALPDRWAGIVAYGAH
jgi:tetratricopeptide (TPR) repeat protein